MSRSITVLRFTRKNGTHTNVTKVIYDEYRNIFASYCVCNVHGPIANENRAVGYFAISLFKDLPNGTLPSSTRKIAFDVSLSSPRFVSSFIWNVPRCRRKRFSKSLAS